MNVLIEIFTSTISPWIFLLILVGIIYIAIKGLGREETTEEKRYNYQRKQFFMTKTEHVFYKELVQIVGNEYFVFAQVHLPTIVESKVRGQGWRGARAHIDRKSVDFVLCDKEYISPKLAIELDDWSHSDPVRQRRDREVERILETAGVPLLRVTGAEGLKEQIQEKIQLK